MVENIVQEALGMVQNRWRGQEVPPVIVLAGEGWNVGVVGIVASKILERFYRPVVILGLIPRRGTAKVPPDRFQDSIFMRLCIPAKTSWTTLGVIHPQRA